MLFNLLNRVNLLRPVEAFLVRWFDFSIVSRHVCGQAGVPPVPTFTITTIGRTSGDLVATPLFYFRDGDAYVVIGSVGGAPQHPSWFQNLAADPQAWVRVRRSQRSVRAEVVTGEERASLWDRVTKAYPPYVEYQERAQAREIPVVRLRSVRS